ncbi:MAG: protein phosphatase 2C domain-containing protein [Methylococcaceae bacterium]|nr:protein phosphatase 2C domain-containing protein [Methylococcaceae bacterium]MCI0733931.1 protein phosphatase 2C domain-containing protein [Methylococcaceae bacterium]
MPLTEPGAYFRCAAAQDADGKQDQGRCEDALPILTELSGGRVLLGVADGLGGYARGFDGRSGGQIASATAMKAAADVFRRAAPAEHPDAEALTNSIFKRLRHLAETRLEPSGIRGTLGRHKLATTLALVVLDARPLRSTTRIQCYWIGDSRIYFLGREGLHQLTRDDNLAGADAFDSIFDPPPMSRFLAASMEREWRIHVRELNLDCPGVVIACTDGCYSEWRSPWGFEAALQQALEQSGSWKEWIERFRFALQPLLSDDASLVAFPLKLLDFKEFQKLRAETRGALQECLKAERERGLQAKEIWTSIYKTTYESIPVGGKDLLSDSVLAKPENPAARTIVFSGPVQSRSRMLSRLDSRWSIPGLAWLAGFACGLPFGEKFMVWLEFFWRWFKSLWQST